MQFSLFDFYFTGQTYTDKDRFLFEQISTRIDKISPIVCNPNYSFNFYLRCFLIEISGYYKDPNDVLHIIPKIKYAWLKFEYKNSEDITGSSSVG